MKVLFVQEMIENGELTIAQTKEIVKNAKFMCKICGRVAVKEENLCMPIPL